jgi:hypothetical protein
VVGEVESLVHEKGLALSITLPASLPKLRSDPLHVRQVLLNLLGNAVKFTPAGGRVTVRGSLVEAPAGRPPFPRHPLGAGPGRRARAGQPRPVGARRRSARHRRGGAPAARARRVRAGGPARRVGGVAGGRHRRGHRA